MNIKKLCLLIYSNISFNTKKYECIDNNKYCEDWSKLGECFINTDYMFKNCRKSCNICNFIDHDLLCNYWSIIGECKNNPIYMKKYCKNSC